MPKRGETTGMQKMLASVVALVWVAVVVTPMFLPVDLSPQVQIGVQTAMMVVLGALFGVGLIRSQNGGDK